jgi:hypothetical protein
MTERPSPEPPLRIRALTIALSNDWKRTLKAIDKPKAKRRG